MANHPRTRKRVHAITSRRAPDGSAFQNCDICGETVAISVATVANASSKCIIKRRTLYMLLRDCSEVKTEWYDLGFNWDDSDWDDAASWIMDAASEPSSFSFDLCLREDDETDSAIVGKFDKFYQESEYYEMSDSDEHYQFAGVESLNTREWEMQQPGTDECSSSS